MRALLRSKEVDKIASHPLYPENFLMKYPVLSPLPIWSLPSEFPHAVCRSSALLVDELVPGVVRKNTSITMGLWN